MKENEYQCECCLQVFEKGWSEEEMIAELEENGWGHLSKEELSVVCDDCYKEMKQIYND